jgi:hypothetical protein
LDCGDYGWNFDPNTGIKQQDALLLHILTNSHKLFTALTRLPIIPVVEFEYSYDGQTLRSKRWRAGNYVHGQQLKALSVIRRYQVGAIINVFANPNNPEKAFLEHGISPASWVFLLVGLIFSATTLVSVIWP